MTLGLRVSCNVHEHRFEKRMCLHQVKLYPLFSGTTDILHVSSTQ